MTKKGLLFAGAVLVAGCSAVPVPISMAQSFEPTLTRQYLPNRGVVGECTGVKCRIDLKVVDPEGACEPRPADPINELIRIKGKKNLKVQVVWLLEDGYLFVAKNGDGIKFKNGGNRFDECKVLGNGREYQCYDKMEEKDVIYNYTIQATRTSGGKKCIYDPGLVNDWAPTP